MARRPLVPMEPRGSIVADPRVQRVLVPEPRRLVVLSASDCECIDARSETRFPVSNLVGAIVWAPEEFVERLRELGAFARGLPSETEDADLPAAAGTPAPTSDVSEVRPVVAELVSELPEELRGDVAAFVERELSEAGL